MRHIGTWALAAVAACSLATLSKGVDAKTADELASACTGLAGRAIDASLIGLPSGGGKITGAETATLVAATQSARPTAR